MKRTQYICDRCGKAIDTPVRIEVRSGRINPLNPMSELMFRKLIGVKSIDYCNECFGSIKQFVKLVGDENEENM